jgi:hypothetical protein
MPIYTPPVYTFIHPCMISDTYPVVSLFSPIFSCTSSHTPPVCPAILPCMPFHTPYAYAYSVCLRIHVRIRIHLYPMLYTAKMAYPRRQNGRLPKWRIHTAKMAPATRILNHTPPVSNPIHRKTRRCARHAHIPPKSVCIPIHTCTQ